MHIIIIPTQHQAVPSPTYNLCVRQYLSRVWSALSRMERDCVAMCAVRAIREQVGELGGFGRMWVRRAHFILENKIQINILFSKHFNVPYIHIEFDWTNSICYCCISSFFGLPQLRVICLYKWPSNRSFSNFTSIPFVCVAGVCVCVSIYIDSNKRTHNFCWSPVCDTDIPKIRHCHWQALTFLWGDCEMYNVAMFDDIRDRTLWASKENTFNLPFRFRYGE